MSLRLPQRRRLAARGDRLVITLTTPVAKHPAVASDQLAGSPLAQRVVFSHRLHRDPSL